MRDLNDLAFFVAVVEQRGFAAAGRVLGIPKSRLSRRIALLEEQLGVRLLQRSTRRFAVTEIGQEFVQHCRAMLAEADAAQNVIESRRAQPRGLVRLSCPVELAQSVLAPLVPEFLAAYPQVQLQILVSNRRVDVINEGIDLALRVRSRLDTDAELVMRELGSSHAWLVASPAYLDRCGRPTVPAQLSAHASMSIIEQETLQSWSLLAATGESVVVEHTPYIRCGEFGVLLRAAIAGGGIVALPQSVCTAALCAGELQRVLPHWRLPQGIVHVVYPSRRGVLPAVRALMEFLVERVPPIIASWSADVAACASAEA